MARGAWRARRFRPRTSPPLRGASAVPGPPPSSSRVSSWFHMQRSAGRDARCLDRMPTLRGKVLELRECGDRRPREALRRRVAAVRSSTPTLRLAPRALRSSPRLLRFPGGRSVMRLSGLVGSGEPHSNRLRLLRRHRSLDASDRRSRRVSGDRVERTRGRWRGRTGGR